MINVAQPEDYGSQKRQQPTLVDVEQSFTIGLDASVPSLEEHLEVFRQFLERGDMVSQTADAWFRVADQEGPDSSNAKSLASLCQQALDARKLSTGFDEMKLKVMKEALWKYPKPVWKRGGIPSIAVGDRLSILGILYLKWHHMISTMTETEAKVFKRQKDTLDSEESLYLETHSVASTLASTQNECIICLNIAAMQCRQCDAWICCHLCRASHEEEAHHDWSSSSKTDIIGKEIQVSTGSTALFNTQMLARNILTDIVFDRNRPVLASSAIHFDSINHDDLRAMALMVEVEFYAGLKNAGEDEADSAKRVPRADDVFMAKTGVYAQGGEKLLCRRIDGELWCLNKYNEIVDIDLADYRVASISGVARILENLLRPPAPLSLMDLAMRREGLADLVSYDPELVHPFAKSLNRMQRKVIATVTDDSFQEGFLAVHAPPGTGKTTTGKF